MRQALDTNRQQQIAEEKKNCTAMETNLGWRPLTKFLRKVARALKVGANLRYNIKTKKRVS